jgi:hypothetical protein
MDMSIEKEPLLFIFWKENDSNVTYHSLRTGPLVPVRGYDGIGSKKKK